MKLRLRNTMVGLTVGIVAVVVAATSVGAYLYGTHHYDRLLETARTTAHSQAEMIRIALEHQMVEKDRSLIQEMVERFASDPSIDGVMLLDKAGSVRYSSAGATTERSFSTTSRTCKSCHEKPPSERETSRVFDTRDGSVLRTVMPIRNRKECFGCHPSAQRVNGILLVDINAGRIKKGLASDLSWMVVGTAVLALVILAGVAIIVRLVVLRRLSRFETTARQIAAGMFDRRVPVTGDDTLSWLAREFNMMADSVTTLLTDVRRQREQLETVINGIDEGIVVLDPTLTVIAANDAFLRRVGRLREDAMGRPCRDVAHDLCPAEGCPARGCLRTGDRQTTIVALRNDGAEPRYEEVRASTIRNKEGRILHVVEVWRDITDRRTAEARMADAQRMAALGMLASGFSHELNTPLGTILVCLDGLVRAAERGGSSAEHVLQMAGIAREQVLRCRGITQQFLRLARGGERAHDDALELDAAVRSILRLVAPTATDRGIEVASRPTAGPITVRANEAHVQQVLMNLLINAIQACERGGRVDVGIEVGAEIRVTVCDTGCGITPEDESRIFDPFFSARAGGTGLGLFLSRDFARGWGGDVRVASTSARGSTFWVTFPSHHAQLEAHHG